MSKERLVSWIIDIALAIVTGLVVGLAHGYAAGFCTVVALSYLAETNSHLRGLRGR